MCNILHKVDSIFFTDYCEYLQIVHVRVCCPGVVCESGGHLPVDQLPVCLPVCDRVRSRELLHHSGGDEEDEEGEGKLTLLHLTGNQHLILTQQLTLVANWRHCIRSNTRSLLPTKRWSTCCPPVYCTFLISLYFYFTPLL